MAVNRDKPDRWKADIARSVDAYNHWFLAFAPQTYREARIEMTEEVKSALALTDNLRDMTPAALKKNPRVLPMLRMATAPPIARDRLIGLSGVSPLLIYCMEEDKRVPPKMKADKCDQELTRISETIARLLDKDLFPWLDSGRAPSDEEVYRGATIVADRLTGAVANPIIRNAQERRQLAAIRAWLEQRGYHHVRVADVANIKVMKAGTFTFRINVPVQLDGGKRINIPADAAIMVKTAPAGSLPLLVEAKSAGDFTNVNKRRKEEATKVKQLRATYGSEVQFVLFLCGYFDSGYLGYEAAEGIDWIWEHRIDDFVDFGV